MKSPKASTAKLTYHVKQLRKMFARADDQAFLQMIWAIDALQSHRIKEAAQYLTFPKEAAISSAGSRYAIYRWELETLLNQLFLTLKQEIKPGPNLILDCRKFESMRETINRLRKLEDVESATYLNGDNVLMEMHRIAQRQFHWQHGYYNMPQFYRYSYLYGNSKCADYFERAHGLTIADLTFVSFALFCGYQSKPWLRLPLAIPEIGLTEELVKRALPLLALSTDQARSKTRALNADMEKLHGSPIPTAYLPTILRRFPLVSTNDGLTIAPVPEALLIRVTSGLYYDLVPGGAAILNEANDRFEQYCVDYITAMLPHFATSRSYNYRAKGAGYDSPDVLIRDNGKLVAVADCKATKLTYLAQFAENPFDAQKKQYEQIARGVFQVWRFYSHVRRGLTKEEVAKDSYTILFTLDSFLTMSRELKAQVLAQAAILADKDGQITDEDRKPVVFCAIHELEGVLSTATEKSFLAALKATQEEKFTGWRLPEVHRNSVDEKLPKKKFPFKLDAVLPWWRKTQERLEAAEVSPSADLI